MSLIILTGLSHAVSSSPIEQAGTIVLAAGTSRRLTLEFQVVELGRQCHRVEILDQANKSVGSGTACVEAVPRDSPAAAQSGVGGNQLPSTKPPMQQGPGSFRPEVNTGQPSSAPQPSGSPFLPKIVGAQPSSTPPQPSSTPPQASSTPPQAENVLQQTGPKREGGQVSGSGLPTTQDGMTPQGLAPVPIATPPKASEATAVPSVTMPNVGSLSTSPPASPAFEVTLAGPSELSTGGGRVCCDNQKCRTAASEETSLEVTWDQSLHP